MFDAITRSLDKQFNKDRSIPSNIERVYYTFFEKGISLIEFNKLPIPYIMGIMRTQSYINKLQEKEMKKGKK